MSKIGFIGLGIMGLPMAKRLIKEGYSLVVYNRSKKSVHELVALGAEAGASPKDTAHQVDVLITMLPDSSDVETVVLGNQGAIHGLDKGDMLIDMSSIDPNMTTHIANQLGQQNIRMLDAPVSGGEAGAIDGTLAIMVGGAGENVEQYRDLLFVMGDSVQRVGDIGSGNVVKLVNQSIVAINIAAVSEAFVLGSKSGVEPDAIFEAIKGGLAGSHVLDTKHSKMAHHDFAPGFTLDLHKKDLDNVLQAAEEKQTSMPLTTMVSSFMENLIESGDGQLDHSALFKFYQTLTGLYTEKRT